MAQPATVALTGQALGLAIETARKDPSPANIEAVAQVACRLLETRQTFSHFGWGSYPVDSDRRGVAVRSPELVSSLQELNASPALMGRILEGAVGAVWEEMYSPGPNGRSPDRLNLYVTLVEHLGRAIASKDFAAAMTGRNLSTSLSQLGDVAVGLTLSGERNAASQTPNFESAYALMHAAQVMRTTQVRILDLQLESKQATEADSDAFGAAGIGLPANPSQ